MTTGPDPESRPDFLFTPPVYARIDELVNEAYQAQPPLIAPRSWVTYGDVIDQQRIGRRQHRRRSQSMDTQTSIYNGSNTYHVQEPIEDVVRVVEDKSRFELCLFKDEDNKTIAIMKESIYSIRDEREG